jgi:hypothetical protein
LGELRRDVVVAPFAVSLTIAMVAITQPTGPSIAALSVALPTLLAVGVAALLAARVTVLVRVVAATVGRRATPPRPLPRESHPDCAGHVRARAPARRPV